MIWLTWVGCAARGPGLLGPPDSDADGVPDGVDDCRTLEETPNDYVDDDGCPDYLPTVRLAPSFSGEPVEEAITQISVGRSPFITVEGTVTAQELRPGTRIEARAMHHCLYGERSWEVHDRANVVELELEPVRNTDVRWRVVDAGGEPIENAAVDWLEASHPACLPDTPWVLEDGAHQGELGGGTYLASVEAPGFSAEQKEIEVVVGQPLEITTRLDRPEGTELPARRADPLQEEEAPSFRAAPRPR